MLDLTADTASDVYLGMYSDTCLSDLAVVVYKSSVNGGAACAYFAMDFLGQLEESMSNPSLLPIP